ncbi:hypothetical protein ACQWB2_26125, partial [Salmonella enterica subsp. enterica serovar Infantis]
IWWRFHINSLPMLSWASQVGDGLLQLMPSQKPESVYRASQAESVS